MNPLIVGIRFQRIGKIYHFDASSVPDIQIGDQAVVETSRGRQLGEVIQIIPAPPPPPEGTWKHIQRRATPRDLVLRQIWQKKELEAMINCRAKSAELKQEGVKIVAAEFTFDGARLSFLYSTETEGKVDLKRLRNAMQRLYPRSLVDMRLIGPRDVAKILGGMGACGMANRCCSTFLTEFSPISIKMAKEQGISLTPSEITGMCGRLRCCLVYEYEQYVEARKQLPKRNKRVQTPNGEGRVYDTYPLKMAVVVEYDDGNRREFLWEELQPLDELEALRKKAEGPCDKHENGECDCGKNVTAAAAETPPGAETGSRDQTGLPEARRTGERPTQPVRPAGPQPARMQRLERPQPGVPADQPRPPAASRLADRANEIEADIPMERRGKKFPPRPGKGGQQSRGTQGPGAQNAPGQPPRSNRPNQKSRPKPKKKKMPPPSEPI